MRNLPFPNSLCSLATAGMRRTAWGVMSSSSIPDGPSTHCQVPPPSAARRLSHTVTLWNQPSRNRNGRTDDQYIVRISLIVHPNKRMATIVQIRWTAETRYGLIRHIRPLIAAKRAIQERRNVATANNMPAGCARKAAANCARTVWEKAVVIPQVGQGMPRMRIAEHGGKPSC